MFGVCPDAGEAAWAAGAAAGADLRARLQKFCHGGGGSSEHCSRALLAMAAQQEGDEWVRLIHPKTQVAYYANLRTRQTSWMPPEGVGDAGDDEDDSGPQYVKLQNGWFQYEDPATGRFYYYNNRTQETVWKIPEEAKPPPVHARDSSAFGPVTGNEEEETDHEDGDEDDEDVEEDEEVERRTRTEFQRQTEEKAAKRAARRLKILEEMMATERTYVQALRTLKKVYLVPLRTVADLPAGKGQIFTHQDLDAIFVNIDLIITVNEGFLRELDTELEARGGQWGAVQFGVIMKRAAKQFKGCYTRYVNNFDTAQEHLRKLADSDKEKIRYLDVCKTHPDANGLDVRSFLIQPVQRVPRYRMLLDELLAHTEDSHADEAPLRDALERVCEVAMHINEEKRALDNYEQMRLLVQKFAGERAALEKELVSYERRLVKQGTMSKIRKANRQQREVFLCNDVLLYAAQPLGTQKGLSLKGRIWLHNGAKINLLPSTESCPHGFALVARDGKGYTWLAESEIEQREWFEAISAAIDEVSGRKSKVRSTSVVAAEMLSRLGVSSLDERVENVRAGCALTKYNQRDGKSSQRWVKLVGSKVAWGDAKSRSCNSDLDLTSATALVHGAKGAAFYKAGKNAGGSKTHQDWQCFSVVTKERTLDLACETVDELFDWYLALASLLQHSTEPLMDEAGLRTRIEAMI